MDHKLSQEAFERLQSAIVQFEILRYVEKLPLAYVHHQAIDIALAKYGVERCHDLIQLLHKLRPIVEDKDGVQQNEAGLVLDKV